MTPHTSLRWFITLIFLINLAACAALPELKKEESENANPDLIELQKQADNAYVRNDAAASERLYLILVRELPEDAQNWFRLANIYAQTNRPIAAINLYREAVSRDPSYSSAWLNMSITQLKQAAYSLTEMLDRIDKNDPTYTKGEDLLYGIQSIIKQD